MGLSANLVSLNKDIDLFPQVFHITPEMTNARKGISRLVMLDRYSFKDIEKLTLKEGDLVVLTVKNHPKFPARGLGIVKSINLANEVMIQVDEEFRGPLEGKEAETGLVKRGMDDIEKPLELFYEQIALRVARALASVDDSDPVVFLERFDEFFKELNEMNFVPAGRVLYGAGSGTDVTYFNCYVMPHPKDSREGIADHRREVIEIMSRGGGVGTNGSTLRPRNTLARGVNGKSSGSVSWLDDISKLTNLVEQGGSRRGAQMIMLNDWHPDIIEFIISKMQNANILRYIAENFEDEEIKTLAKNKLNFIKFTQEEKDELEAAANYYDADPENEDKYNKVLEKIELGGRYDVHRKDFLEGANISVNITHEFMEAVENDLEYELRFPDVESYNKEEMKSYNEHWHTIGDVREWERMGYKIRTYRKIKAREMWNLINFCATYSAEPGIFFIDNANDKTNAVSYGQKVVATNPCGEQPLAPYSVCNLAAVNLGNMAKGRSVDYAKLENTVRVGVRMQDNVIDATPYFLDKNTKQAQGERRVGLGVMGLHDLLIKCEITYGSEESNKLVDEVFEFISHIAYKESIEIAKEKGSFPFLKDKNSRRKFVNSGYMKNMPLDIREDILKYGIRNSHLLTVAPTGTTGTLVGVSTGLEPYFNFIYYRSGRLGQFIPVVADIALEWLTNNGYEVTEENTEELLKELPEWFLGAMDLSPEAHADTQCIIQKHVDSSLSKTVNAPKGYSVEQVAKVYERLHKGGAKGGTVYVDGSRDAQVLSLTKEDNNLDNEIKIVAKVIAEELDEDQYGTEIGKICMICRKGVIEDQGGCNTCTNCKAQLSCGL